MEFDKTVEYLLKHAPFQPKIGVVCGSGLGGLAELLENPKKIEYRDIPGFPQPTVVGHKGQVAFGTVGKTKVVALKGRFHSYEGYDMNIVSLPGKLFKALGCEIIITTNAAGGINRMFNVGDLMIITDHISIPLMAGKNPLVGPNDDRYGPRFPAMSSAYNKSLRLLAIDCAKKLEINFIRNSGTYAMVSGPNYETSAESMFLMKIGADAVGMSTVPEVTTAVHCGLKVLGLSLITNRVVLPGGTTQPASHEEVLDTVLKRTNEIEKLVRHILEELADEGWEEKIKSSFCNNVVEISTEKKKSIEESVIESIKRISISDTTPLQALNTLKILQDQLRS